jgi:hypothetical protein
MSEWLQGIGTSLGWGMRPANPISSITQADTGAPDGHRAHSGAAGGRGVQATGMFVPSADETWAETLGTVHN